MKTIAILLFSALSLTGCATDETRDLDPIDKDSDSAQPLDELLHDGSEDAVDRYLEQQIEDLLGPRGGVLDAIEERIPGLVPDPHHGLLDSFEHRISDLPNPHGGLVDAIDERVTVPAPNNVDWIDMIRPRFFSSRSDAAEVEDKIKEIEASSRDNHVGEFAEDILVKDRSFTLIHGANGSHYLVDADSNVYLINR